MGGCAISTTDIIFEEYLEQLEANKAQYSFTVSRGDWRVDHVDLAKLRLGSRIRRVIIDNSITFRRLPKASVWKTDNDTAACVVWFRALRFATCPKECYAKALAEINDLNSDNLHSVLWLDTDNGAISCQYLAVVPKGHAWQLCLHYRIMLLGNVCKTIERLAPTVKVSGLM